MVGATVTSHFSQFLHDYLSIDGLNFRFLFFLMVGWYRATNQYSDIITREVDVVAEIIVGWRHFVMLS